MAGVRVGLVSDTHGYLDRWLWPLFGGVERILHAGDIGGYHLVRELATIAPVEAIRGNTDGFHSRYGELLTTAVAGTSIHIRHKVDLGPAALSALARSIGADVVLFGHSHRPFLEQRGRTLFVNPGSATKSRTGTNTAGILVIDEAGLSVTIHELREGLPVYLAQRALEEPGTTIARAGERASGGQSPAV